MASVQQLGGENYKTMDLTQLLMNWYHIICLTFHIICSIKFPTVKKTYGPSTLFTLYHRRLLLANHDVWFMIIGSPEFGTGCFEVYSWQRTVVWEPKLDPNQMKSTDLSKFAIYGEGFTKMYVPAAVPKFGCKTGKKLTWTNIYM